MRIRQQNLDSHAMDRIINKAGRLSKQLSLRFNKDFDKLAGMLPPRFITFLKEAWIAMEEIYPGRCDIQYDVQPKFEMVTNRYGSNHVPVVTILEKYVIKNLYFVIHFPEFIITNGPSRNHTIKDLYTRLPVKVNGGSRGRLEFEKIQGTRTTLTLAEFESHYLHSHLSGRDYVANPNLKCEYANFCTGDGDINASTALLSGDLDIDIFRLLLYQVQPFVEWESLEGNPYKKFTDIAVKEFTLNTAELSQAVEMWKSLKYRVRRNPEKFDIDWKYENGSYVVIDNEKFEDVLREYGVNYIDNNRYFLYKDEMNNYFNQKKPDPSYFRPSPEWLPFRNNKIHFKIVGESAGVKALKYMHPKLKYYVKQQLEIRANSSSIRKSAIEQYNKNALTPTVY